MTRVAYVLCAAFLLLVVLHLYWAFGGMWGLAAALGRPEVEASRLLRGGAAAVAIALMAAAAIVLGRVGVWRTTLPWFLFSWGTWGIAASLVLAGVLNLTSRTWLERLGFAPIAFVLASLAIVVSRSPRP